MTGFSISFPLSLLGISLLPKLSVEQDEEWVEVEEWGIVYETYRVNCENEMKCGTNFGVVNATYSTHQIFNMSDVIYLVLNA